MEQETPNNEHIVSSLLLLSPEEIGTHILDHILLNPDCDISKLNLLKAIRFAPRESDDKEKGKGKEKSKKKKALVLRTPLKSRTRRTLRLARELYSACYIDCTVMILPYPLPSIS